MGKMSLCAVYYYLTSCLVCLSSGEANAQDRKNIVKGEDEPFQPSVPDAHVKASDQDEGINYFDWSIYLYTK